MTSGEREANCKIDRISRKWNIADLDDQLLERRRSGASLRELETYYNQQVLEAAMREAGIETLDGEVENLYHLLTDDEVSSGTRIEARSRLERDLVTAFNESMQRVLDMLDYENVERVWIERFAGRSDAQSDTEFELHIVRTDEDGAAYEDTIDSLSKSEREVIGLVVAFAGYLAHDVADELPIIVVDAVEMLDADRIHGLLNYLEQHAEYVVAAVLPEEAAELEETYPTVPTSAFTAES